MLVPLAFGIVDLVSKYLQRKFQGLFLAFSYPPLARIVYATLVGSDVRLGPGCKGPTLCR
jgi:hypothetical protein